MTITSAEIRGLDDLAKRFGVAVERFAEAAKVAVYGQGLALDELINRNDMVPVKSGGLRASHFVTLPKEGGDAVSIQMGYGAPYAAQVHERGNGNGFRGLLGGHDTHNSWKNGTPKWMERGVSMWARSYAARCTDSIRRAVVDGTRVEDLLGAVPTEPHYSAEVTESQRWTGMTREQRRTMFQLRRKGLIRGVGRKKDRRYWAEKKGQTFTPKKPWKNRKSVYRTKKGE